VKGKRKGGGEEGEEEGRGREEGEGAEGERERGETGRGLVCDGYQQPSSNDDLVYHKVVLPDLCGRGLG
jgi:hypothetical protein